MSLSLLKIRVKSKVNLESSLGQIISPKNVLVVEIEGGYWVFDSFSLYIWIHVPFFFPFSVLLGKGKNSQRRANHAGNTILDEGGPKINKRWWNRVLLLICFERNGFLYFSRYVRKISIYCCVIIVLDNPSSLRRFTRVWKRNYNHCRKDRRNHIRRPAIFLDRLNYWKQMENE